MLVQVAETLVGAGQQVAETYNMLYGMSRFPFSFTFECQHYLPFCLYLVSQSFLYTRYLVNNKFIVFILTKVYKKSTRWHYPAVMNS